MVDTFSWARLSSEGGDDGECVCVKRFLSETSFTDGAGTLRALKLVGGAENLWSAPAS